ncbi:molybdopterin-dependent oxidoreductase [Methylocella sp.]|uniref:molybdopterin-dependent oxidoreductase n=1 Tax=Methylocella sp. TaxID=1978226 RepID=UPI0037851CB9
MRSVSAAHVALVLALLSPFFAADGASAENAKPARARTVEFVVSGAVRAEKTFDAAALAALPRTTAEVVYAGGGEVRRQRFSGALLWDVLNAAGLALDPSVHNDALRKVVTISASDGYEVALSVGEIDPAFGAAPVMVAYEADGAPLGDSGFARLVAPGDKRPGRFVSNIARIEVRDATKP